jgi:quinol monooxygenase YgiN
VSHEHQVVELRQYTLHPGRRDELITLFDREFIETQEALGMRVLGQFRDLDAPDRFVWLRGFADMASRAAALAAFYGGPVWQAHRDAANATMIDSDNVLLLSPAWPGAGIDMQGRTRAARAANTQLPGVLDATVWPLHEPASPELLRFCRDVMTPLLARGGAQVLGWYVTESAPNNFPRLPVREGETVLVGFALFDDAAALDHFMRSGAWAREVEPALTSWLSRPAECLRLTPTARSAIHAR